MSQGEITFMDIFNAIRLTTVEKMMLATCNTENDKKEVINKITSARLQFKAYQKNSNIADDIAIITDIINQNPEATNPPPAEQTELPTLITIDGIEIKMYRKLNDINLTDIIDRIKLCNKYI